MVKYTYIWLTFMVNVAKQIQTYKNPPPSSPGEGEPPRSSGELLVLCVPRYSEEHLHGSATSGIKAFYRQLFYPRSVCQEGGENGNLLGCPGTEVRING